MSFLDAYSQFASPIVGEQLTVKATFVSVNGQNVTLKTASGVQFTVAGTDIIAPATAGQ